MKTDKPRVIHVVANLDIGGITRFLLDLVSYQNDYNKIDIAIFSLSSANNKWENLFNQLNVKVYYGGDSPSSFSIECIKKFHKIKSNYNIVHWHSFFPVLVMSCIGDNLAHIITHHSVLGEGRVKNALYNIKWNLFRIIVNHKFSCEIYNSYFTKNFWKSKKLQAKHSCVIYNGSNLFKTKVNISQPIDKQSNFYIGTSSNFIQCKRVDFLIKGFAEWSKGKDNVRLLLVGTGPEMENLKKLVENFGISNLVNFVGHKVDVTNYQNSMDLCVFPSVGETFGLAALECMYLGKPVICMSDGGGICEVVGQSSHDIVKDITGMIERFDFYYNNPNEISKISQKLKERSLLFDMKDKSLEYLDVYRNIL